MLFVVCHSYVSKVSLSSKGVQTSSVKEKGVVPPGFLKTRVHRVAPRLTPMFFIIKLENVASSVKEKSLIGVALGLA